MESNFHVVEQRLENIKTIKPLLMSLRTISLSSWKLSLNKLSYLNKYSQDLDRALSTIIKPAPQDNKSLDRDRYLVVLGSTRGLCGSFNRDLFHHLENFLQENDRDRIKFILFGEKIKKLFIQNNLDLYMSFDYPRISALNYQYIYQLVNQISGSESLPNLLLLFNHYQGSSKYETIIQHVLPASTAYQADRNNHEDILIDGNLNDLIKFHQKQKFLISIYKAFLYSFAAEHSRRFEIMETSLSNMDKLIQELTISAQAERQKKVTSEMRELSISAGLLEK